MFYSNVTVAMEADSAGGAIGEGTSAVCRDEEAASTGDNSLTSCEDDVLLTTTGAVDDDVKLALQPRPTPTHSSLCSPGNTIASGLPTTLQLCKVQISV